MIRLFFKEPIPILDTVGDGTCADTGMVKLWPKSCPLVHGRFVVLALILLLLLSQTVVSPISMLKLRFTLFMCIRVHHEIMVKSKILGSTLLGAPNVRL